MINIKMFIKHCLKNVRVKHKRSVLKDPVTETKAAAHP